jgi:hypothetical protein
LIRQRAPFQARSGEPTAMQFGSGRAGNGLQRSGAAHPAIARSGLPDRSPAQMEASVTSELEGSKETIAAPV